MRILTFNVNSLQRLLNHPIQHIFKGQAKAATLAASANDQSTSAPPVQECKEGDEGSADKMDDDAEWNDERFAWMDDPDLGDSFAESAANTAAAAASPVTPATSTTAATPSSTTPAPQPRSQAEIDALTAAQQAEWREFSAHAAAATTSTALFSGALGTRLSALLDGLQADIICFQEVKMARGRIPEHMAVVDGWHAFFSFSRKRQGYSGVVTYVKKTTATPIKAEEGFTGMLAASSTTQHPSAHANATSIGEYSAMYAEMDPVTLKALDSEGRCVVTDHERFVLFNFYMPNAPSATKENPDDTSRLEYKLLFYKALQLRVEALVAAGRNVIIVGDVNACHKPIDHCDYVSPSPRAEREPFENANREWLGKFLVDGGGMFVDVFRRFHPDRQKAYTCWNTKTGARLSNYGARIDYILANVDLYESGFFTRCDIRPDIHCSDHCPVEADINVATLCNDPNRAPPPLCSRFMPEFSGAQQNIKSFFTKGAVTAATAANLSVGTSKESSPSTSPTASPSKVTTLKRPHSLPTTGPAAKTQKLNHAGRKAAGGGAPQQQEKKTVSLHSFFGASQAPKEKAASNAKATPGATKADPMDLCASNIMPVVSAPSPGTIASAYASASSAVSPHLSPPPSTSVSPPAPPAVAPAAAWKTLLNQKSEEMKCRKHQLRCKLLTVGKAGVNHGREFYM